MIDSLEVKVLYPAW